MEIRKEIQDLFNKAKALKGKQVLHTTFGAWNYYTITKVGKQFFINEFRNKYSFQKEGKFQSGKDFKDVEGLNRIIFSHTGLEWYAKNHFTLAIVHLDNWINFVNAFKVKELIFTDNGNVTENFYHYQEIKEKDLEVSI